MTGRFDRCLSLCVCICPFSARPNRQVRVTEMIEPVRSGTRINAAVSEAFSPHLQRSPFLRELFPTPSLAAPHKMRASTIAAVLTSAAVAYAQNVVDVSRSLPWGTASVLTSGCRSKLARLLLIRGECSNSCPSTSLPPTAQSSASPSRVSRATTR